MNNVKSLVLTLVSLSSLFTSCVPLECPPSETISPCLCVPQPESVISCNGASITLEVIRNVFAKVKEANTQFYADRFEMHETLIDVLEETPFLQMNFNVFNVSNNAHLYDIAAKYGHLGGGEKDFRIGAATFVGDNCAFVEKTFQVLSIFATSMKHLSLRGNKITGLYGTVWDGGLKRLTNLETLNLSNNGITNVGGGELAFNNRLLLIDLSDNYISALWNEAFKINNPDFDAMSKDLHIVLDNNQLSDTGIMYTNAFQSVNRQAFVHLKNNNFVSFSERNFSPFLFANKRNYLLAGGNPTLCDSKMKWMKNLAGILRDRVLDVVCSNGGQSVFDFSFANSSCSDLKRDYCLLGSPM